MEKLVTLDDFAREIHETAKEKGFWEPCKRMLPEDQFIFYCKQIAMIHSEATEVLEALRKNKGQQAVVEELADIIIRVLDLYQGLYSKLDVDDSLHEVFLSKIDTNKTRKRLHGVKG